MKRLLTLILLTASHLPLYAADSPAGGGFAAPQLPVVELTLNGRQTTIEMEDLRNPLMLIQTTRGDLVVELYPEEAPRTVANFVELAEGTKSITDSYSGRQVQRPFYDGLTFHRIIPGFIIQGGSPDNSPDGSPGYSLPHEINALRLGLNRMPLLDSEGYPNPVLGLHDQQDFQQQVLQPLYQDMGISTEAELQERIAEVDERLRNMNIQQLYELYGYEYTQRFPSRAPVRGMIAMASEGPESNGSQFFFTLDDAPWLTGRQTVFGKVRGGIQVLETISQMPTDAAHRPLEQITILLIRRIRV